MMRSRERIEMIGRRKNIHQQAPRDFFKKNFNDFFG